jgi:tRNA(Ile)-lysidine synthase
MSAFVSAVRHTIESYRMLDSNETVLVGVSGGSDSAGLALVLRELGYNMAIGHVNHGLRGEASDEDQRFTESLAARLGVPCFVRKVSVGTGKGNLEAAGREARRAFFREIAAQQGFQKVALAHTREDRVETFLMNLLRGAGVEGLVSMAPVSGTTIRPLIQTSRTAVETWLTSRGQTWQTDLTNLDPSFTRNRLRHKILPMLAAEFNPRLTESLVRTIEILADEDALARAMAEGWLAEHGRFRPDGFIVDIRALQNIHKSLVRRIIRLALRQAGSSLQDVSFDHVESVAGLLVGNKSGKSIVLPSGMAVARNFDEFIFHRTPAIPGQGGLNGQGGEYCYELQIPGRIHIPELGRTFRAEIIDKGKAEAAPDRVFVDGASLGPYVRIRNWKPGDYYRPAGLPSGKLKRLFQRARIPRSQRRTWPVLVANSTIVWVASFPVSREFTPGEHSQKIVAFEASPS